MLRSLSIRNYALIEALDIEFPDGLNIITGETGAGKSVLLGAISLLSGGKADQAVLKRSDKNCVVEGDFGDTILRRVVSPNGRSRCFVNDAPVTIAELEEVSSHLVDIHTQHMHLLLKERGFRMEVLDYFAGTNDVLSLYKAEYKRVAELRSKLSDFDERQKAEAAQREFDEFRLNKLNEANLRSGELEELEEEQKKLANAEEIKSAVYSSYAILDGEEGSVVDKLKEAAGILEKSKGFVSEFQDLGKRIESCKIECKDIADEIERLGSDVVVSPSRLEQVEERMALLYSLVKRFNSSDIEELISLRDELAQRLGDEEAIANERSELAAALSCAEEKMVALAHELSAKRSKAAPLLAKQLEAEIRTLEMPVAKFVVDVTTNESQMTADGADEVKFMFCANGDEQLVELQKVASGGELSRIMLCIKKLLASYSRMPTMFFDEIDVGVSGSIADKMGKMIGEMGRKMQIFAITHLPQVASKGNSHLLVYKKFNDEGVAVTNVKFLDGEERVMELARLLSGERTTDEAIANARVLLAL
ncbi:MAG: DNA repair protein RecN [Candidatus Egerieousia sp.]